MAVENFKSTDIQELIKAFETDIKHKIDFVQSLPDNSPGIKGFGWENTRSVSDQLVQQADNTAMKQAITTFTDSLPQGDIDKSRGHLNAIKDLRKQQENEKQTQLKQCFSEANNSALQDPENQQLLRDVRNSLIQKIVDSSDVGRYFTFDEDDQTTILNFNSCLQRIQSNSDAIITLKNKKGSEQLLNGKLSNLTKALQDLRHIQQTEEYKKLQTKLDTKDKLHIEQQQAQTQRESEKKQEGLNNPEITDFQFLQNASPDITPDSLDQAKAQQLLNTLIDRGLRYGGHDENMKERTGEATRKMYCDNWLNSFGGKNPEGAILLFFRQLTSPENGENGKKVNDFQKQQYLANLLHLFSPEDQLSMIFHLFYDKETDPKKRDLSRTYLRNYDITSDSNYVYALDFFSKKLKSSSNVKWDNFGNVTSFLDNGDEHVKDLLIKFKKEINNFPLYLELQLPLAKIMSTNGDFTNLLNDERLGENRDNLQKIVDTRKNSSVEKTVASN